MGITAFIPMQQQLRRFREIIPVKSLVPRLAHKKGSINGSDFITYCPLRSSSSDSETNSLSGPGFLECDFLLIICSRLPIGPSKPTLALITQLRPWVILWVEWPTELCLELSRNQLNFCLWVFFGILMTLKSSLAAEMDLIYFFPWRLSRIP